MYSFEIKTCYRKGCVYHGEFGCFFNNKVIADWVLVFGSIHDPNQCQVRKQMNIYQTKKLLKGESI